MSAILRQVFRVSAYVVTVFFASASARADFVRWIDGTDNRLREIDLRTRIVRAFGTELPPAAEKMALEGDRSYWSSGSSVFSVNLDGADLRPEPAVPEAVRMKAMGAAVDRAAGVWYWHDFNGVAPSSISTGRLGEREGQTLFSTGTRFFADDEEDVGIAFDPVERKVYWAGWRGPEGGVIQRAGLDGSDLETVYDAAELDFRDGSVHLELDPVHRMLYWHNYERIVRAPLDGGAVPEVIHTGGFPRALTLDITVPEPAALSLLLAALVPWRRWR